MSAPTKEVPTVAVPKDLWERIAKQLWVAEAHAKTLAEGSLGERAEQYAYSAEQTRKCIEGVNAIQRGEAR